MMLNLFGVVVIGINVLIWVVARRLIKIDPDYFKIRDGSLHWLSVDAISQVVKMVFDPQLPDPAHGPGMRKAIYTVRILYVLGIIGAAFFFYQFFAQSRAIFPH